MKKTTRSYPVLDVDAEGTGVASNAGLLVAVETIRAVGLDRELSSALAPWRKPLASHDPGRVVTDLVLSVVAGGDCLADVNLIRSEPALFGAVASDPTVSRTIDALAADAPAVLAAISSARAVVRARAWQAAGSDAPDHEATARKPVVIDVDATLVTAHSEKEQAAPTFKRGYGFHPLWAFVDHGQAGTGEPLSFKLRKGNAGSNTAVDHIEVIGEALTQLPGHRPGRRPGRSVLVRVDGAGGTHELLAWLTRRRLAYSVGYTLPTDFAGTLAKVPPGAWTPAYDADGGIRDGAFVAEVSDLLDLSSWPGGMRVIVRKERPHPGAQLRITDVDGNRITAFATNTPAGGPGTQLADLELRHRRRARCEDRIRCSKDTGLMNLPLHDFAQNEIWCAIVALAVEVTAWMQMLALPGHQARRWEPKRLRTRVFSIAGRVARTARTTTVHLAANAPWVQLAIDGITKLRALPVPSAAPG